MQRRTFTKEFREGAVKLVVQEGVGVKQAAAELGVSVSAMGKWVREHRRKGSAAFPGSGNLSPEDARVRELEKKVRRLKMERDILKKATACVL